MKNKLCKGSTKNTSPIRMSLPYPPQHLTIATNIPIQATLTYLHVNMALATNFSEQATSLHSINISVLTHTLPLVIRRVFIKPFINVQFLCLSAPAGSTDITSQTYIRVFEYIMERISKWIEPRTFTITSMFKSFMPKLLTKKDTAENLD